MNHYSLKMLGLLAGTAVLGTLTMQAQDKATLDLLVKKGVISQADADGVAKSSSNPLAMVTAKDPAVKALKLEGMIQAQYDFLTTKDNLSGATNPPSTNQFELRRVYLGAVADLGNGWGGEVLMDFAGTELTQAPTAGASAINGTTNGQNSFEKVVITKKFDDYNGVAAIGYRKVDFTQEEVTSSSKLKAIERAPVARYFDESYDGIQAKRIGFANRHTGIYWNGNVAGTDTVFDGVYYDLAIANGMNNQNLQVSNSNGAGLNRLSYWAGAGYQGSMDDWKFNFGVYTGVSQNQNNNGVGTPAGTQANAEWGWNPYVTVDYGNFELSAEFLQAWVQRGKWGNPGGTIGTEATPYGFTITPSYKISPQWEIAARYSYLGTNGRGTNISDVERDGINTNTAIGGTTNLYNDVTSYYIGVNYYIMGTSLKLSAGYELDQFNDRQVGAAGSAFSGSGANVSGFRTQLQLQF